MGDGRAEGWSAIGDGGQAAISLTPDADGTHVRIFESSKLGGSYCITDGTVYFFKQQVCPVPYHFLMSDKKLTYSILLSMFQKVNLFAKCIFV